MVERRSIRAILLTPEQEVLMMRIHGPGRLDFFWWIVPGGGVEPGETIEQAALREAHEEIGLPLANVRVLGALTPLDIPVSGFRLHPIVAVSGMRSVLTPSDGEVARILEVDVDELVAPGRLVSIERKRDGRSMVVPAFLAGGEEIWGATAMVLAEFLTLLGWIPPLPT